MQTEILEKEATANLRVYTVWVPFLGGNRDATRRTQGIMSDQRVTQYWDEEAVTSEWFTTNVDGGSGPGYDVFYLYGPDARWSDVPGPLVESGGTVIGQTDRLRAAVGSLLPQAGDR